MTLKSVPPFYWLSIPKYKTQEVRTYTCTLYTFCKKIGIHQLKIEMGNLRYEETNTFSISNNWETESVG